MRAPRCGSLPSVIMGGAGFSYQLHSEPQSLPAVDIIRTAFDSGLRAIDTSPYYDPSEQIIGQALNDSRIRDSYTRSDYVLMTKVGRIASDHFDYSPAWIRESVQRSLNRLHTDYLDVVFCHDVEYVGFDDALSAIGTLMKLQDEGSIDRVGISGYSLPVLAKLSAATLEKYFRPVDVVQCWAQLTLQNTRVATHGLPLFAKAKVGTVCCSSPLAVGLLRSGGVPVGRLGDWHPAPSELRLAAQKAAELVNESSPIARDDLAALALRYALTQAMRLSTPDLEVTTIIGVGSLSDLEQNIRTVKRVLAHLDEGGCSAAQLRAYLPEEDRTMIEQVRGILGPWVDFELSAS